MSFKSGTTSPPSKSFNEHFNENLTRPERKESVLRVVISTSTSPTDLLVQDLRGLLLTIRSLSFSSLQRVTCHKWGGGIMQHCSAQNIYHLRLPELDAKSFCLS